MTGLDYIIIDGTIIPRPPEFSPQREDIYKGDYVTCTGRTIADRVGWKYSDMTLSWDALPQPAVDVLVGMTGVSTLEFDDSDDNIHTESIVRTSVVAMRHKHMQGGVTIWRKVSVNIKFIGSHAEA